ncbi:adrenodoxin reductase, putative [Plasmodium malariae]|uniref:Adrenodoxin reductase, putative n=1 Tax=Plasmodium malariae TaxID=5858 RepID=A0A1C3KD40_PLAMA|nr:adrenodoxin reductase, putative [Plasmodium malariae]
MRIKVECQRRKLFFLSKYFFTNEQKYFKIGVIGAGPSALYCCKYFLKNERIKVDIFDKLPNPYGLLRYGVAPDHVNVKNICNSFNPIILSKNYRFFGNVNIGVNLKIEELRNYYNVIVFCCGASDISLPSVELVEGKEDEMDKGYDRALEVADGLCSERDSEQTYKQVSKQVSKQDVKQEAKQAAGQDAKQAAGQDAKQAAGQDAKQAAGQDAKQADGQDAKQAAGQAAGQTAEQDSKLGRGIFHALDLIYFYNSYYDDMRCKTIDNYLSSLENFSSAVIVGNGNVALDVARILVKSYENLEKTDINNNYLNAMKKHKFKHIYIMGRRGYWQSSFTNSELRELLNLDNTKVILNKKNYSLCSILKNYDENNKMKQRQHKLFLNMVHNYEEFEKNKNIYENYKIIEFIFYHEIKKIHFNNHYMKNVIFQMNKDLNILDSSPYQKKKKVFTTPLLIFATGFKKNQFCENLYNQSILKFKDDILKKKFAIFKAGWFDIGPKGNISSQILNSKKITSHILNFLNNTTEFFHNDISNLLSAKKINFVNFDDWIYIHNLEINTGKQTGKNAQKIRTVEEVLYILNEKKKKKKKLNPD